MCSAAPFENRIPRQQAPAKNARPAPIVTDLRQKPRLGTHLRPWVDDAFWPSSGVHIFTRRLGPKGRQAIKPAAKGARASRPMPHSFCSKWPDSRPEGRVWSAATRRCSGNRVLARQRQLAAVFRRDQCLATGAPRQSRQQAAGVGQHQDVESGDQSPHSKRAMGAIRKNYAALGVPPAKPACARRFTTAAHGRRAVRAEIAKKLILSL